MRDAASASGDWILPEWPAPERIGTLITTRNGGVSVGPWGGAGGTGGMNLGARCGDDVRMVEQNRALLRHFLPAAPYWLNQIHGCEVLDLDNPGMPGQGEVAELPADAARTQTPGIVCAVLAADCLPVLLCDRQGSVVAAAHAGWRGLAAGVLEAAVAAMAVNPAQIMAYLGPAIGPRAFEVGADVRDAFTRGDSGAEVLFHAATAGKWHADLPGLARRRLSAVGVQAIWGGERCTFAEHGHFYSYRRDGVTGRMAALIWIKS